MHSNSDRKSKGRGQKGKNNQKTATKKVKSLSLESLRQSGGKPWDEQVKLLCRGEHCACMKEVVSIMVEYREAGRISELLGIMFRCKGGHAPGHHLAPDHHLALTVVWEGKWVIEIHEVHDSCAYENLLLPIVKTA